jgi:hypothetical protein
MDVLDYFTTDNSVSIDLIDKKIELLGLDRERSNAFNGKIRKIQNTIESLQKLDAYHEKKLELFKNKILFFDNYLTNIVNKTKQTQKTINTTRQLIEEYEAKIIAYSAQMEKLDTRKDRIRETLNKYLKFFNILQSSVVLMGENSSIMNTSSNNTVDVAQLLSRFESLELMKFENQNLASKSSDHLISMKSILFNMINNISDDALYGYKQKAEIEQRLKMLKQSNFELNEAYTSHLDNYLEKLVSQDYVQKSIDNLFDLTNRYCKSTAYNQRRLENMCEKFLLKYQIQNNLYKKKTEKNILRLKQLIFKLVIIKDNIVYLKEITNFSTLKKSF